MQDRWRLRQEQNKLTNLQKMVEEERKVISDQLAAEQTSLQQAKVYKWKMKDLRDKNCDFYFF